MRISETRNRMKAARPRLRLSLNGVENSSSTVSEDSAMSASSTPSRTPLLTEDEKKNDDTSPSSPMSPLVPIESRLEQMDPITDAAEVAEEQILKVMDRFEDEWDGHTYEDIVPTEIKIALEETVFGWSHLVSEFLGYFAFTFGAYAATYLALWHFTQTPRLQWVRWMLSLFAGWTSFRMVRRRRKVWFRAAYGTKEYKDDEDRRRMALIEADQASWLGRIRKNRRTKKLAKQLSRAETSFSRHHEKRLLRAQSEPFDYDSGSISSEQRQLSFRTDPVAVMQSIKHDQITFSTGVIERMPYSHGGFFGAAPFLLANPHWISVLRRLMPDVYVEISKRVGAESRKLIHWAENNPVVAAYGTAQELEYNGIIPTLEWDIFLDPALIRRVEIAMKAREEFLETVLPDDMTVKPYERVADSMKASLTRTQYNILRYYERELEKRVQLLVDEMLIAHGSLTQLILEQTGFGKHYNYSRVKRTRRTLGGGIYARQWMAVYAESLRIGLMEDSIGDGESHFDLTSLDTMNVSACPNTTVAESISIVKSIAKTNDHFGLLFDLKSRHVPKPVLACVVDCLRDAGVRIDGVGTFYINDIRDMSRYCCQPVKELLFFHSAGDMQLACHDGRIRVGDTVFFNAGSLLWKPNRLLKVTAATARLYSNCCLSFDPDHAKRSYELLPHARTSNTPFIRVADTAVDSTIEAYKKRFDLSVGMYVQEFAIDEAAADILVQLVNSSPHVYDLGLSWGGVNGITIRGIKPGRFTSTDGFWNQRYIGAAWDGSLVPPPQLNPIT